MSKWIGIAAALGVLVSIEVGPTAAQTGYALDFDGTDDYVETEDDIDVTGALTIEAWIRPDAFGGRIISNRASGTSFGYELDTYEPGFVRLTADAYAVVWADISAWQGQWVHVAVTWEGPPDGEAILYVDGAAVASNSPNCTLTEPGTGLRIGCGNGYTSFFDGAIDEPRVFARVVSESVLRIWMNRTIDIGHPDLDYLRGAWKFDEGAGQIAVNVAIFPGYDGVLGEEAAPDAADPTWIVSGMVGAESRTWSAVKATYAD
jgi:hypothetical protein